MNATEERQSADLGSSLDPAEIGHALLRRKWIILASALAVAGATAAGTMRQPKIYNATAQIMIEPSMPKVLGNDVGMEELSVQARAARAFNNTQYMTITSRAVLRDVSKRLDLANDADFKKTYELTGEGEALEKEIEEVLHDSITVHPETVSRIVSLVVEDQDPIRAAKIANEVGQAYIDYTLERRLDTTRSASKWLDQRVDEFGKKLENAEQRLHDFKKSNMLVSVSLEDRQNMTGASLGIINQKIVETRTDLIALESKRRILQSALDENGSIEAVPRLASNAVVGELRGALVTLEKSRAELSTRYGAKHPKMVAVENQIKESQTALDREVSLVIGAFDNEIKALKDTMTGLEATIGVEKEKALGINSLALDYSKLTRDFGTTKTTYESLLKRQTDTDLSGLLESNFVQWFQPAEPKLLPIRPSVPKNGMFGLVAGLLLGMLVVVAAVLLDNTVHSQADIERLLRLPFLGVLPRIQEEEQERLAASTSNPGGGSRDLYIINHPKSVVAECARSIRTNLLFMGTEKPLARLLFTSAGPAEGKTTTSIGLGVTMAQAGNKVLLIDTDLRKPRLHRAFGVSGESGVSSVLVDASTIEEAIKSTAVVGLDVLPCGPLPPNPAELFHTEKFAKLLDQLSEMYDRVLLDSPPIGAVTDAAILSKLVDGTVLVVQANKTAKDAVRRAARVLSDVDTKIAGVVLNDFDVSSGAYRYQQYYYYRGYGYGDSEEEAQA